jgi:hypothetical protein
MTIIEENLRNSIAHMEVALRTQKEKIVKLRLKLVICTWALLCSMCVIAGMIIGINL